MRFMPARQLSFLGLVLVLWLIGPERVLAQAPLELSPHERAVYPALAKREDALNELLAAYEKKAKQFNEIEQRSIELARQYAQINQRMQLLDRYMGSLLAALWPLRLQDLQTRLGGLRSWEETDRRFTWLAAAYAGVRAASQAYQGETARLSAIKEEAKGLEQTVKELTPALTQARENYEREKISFEQAVRELRKPKGG